MPVNVLLEPAARQVAGITFQLGFCPEPAVACRNNIVCSPVVHMEADSQTAITVFTSMRTNLSPFTKGCRERDASM